MANYHFEVTIISRGKGRSVTAAMGYISGKTLRDNYSGKTYYNSRNDVIWQKIFLPNDAPQEFRNLQHLCNEIECAEVRRDARTARQFIGSLPNELPPGGLLPPLGVHLRHPLHHLKQPRPPGNTIGFEGGCDNQTDGFIRPALVRYHRIGGLGVQVPLDALHGSVEAAKIMPKNKKCRYCLQSPQKKHKLQKYRHYLL